MSAKPEGMLIRAFRPAAFVWGQKGLGWPQEAQEAQEHECPIPEFCASCAFCGQTLSGPNPACAPATADTLRQSVNMGD